MCRLKAKEIRKQRTIFDNIGNMSVRKYISCCLKINTGRITENSWVCT